VYGKPKSAVLEDPWPEAEFPDRSTRRPEPNPGNSSSAEGPAARRSLSNDLIAFCNASLSIGDRWMIQSGQETWYVDQLRPGGHITVDLGIEIHYGRHTLMVALDRTLTALWFAGVHWSLMAEPVRDKYLAYRARPLLDWFESIVGEPVRLGVAVRVADDGRHAWHARPFLRWRLWRPAGEGEINGAACGAGQGGHIALSVSSDNAQRALAPLVRLIRSVANESESSAAAPLRFGIASRARAHDEQRALAFDVVVARLRLSMTELAGAAVGDLLAIEFPRSPGGRTGDFPAAAVCLGRAPLFHVLPCRQGLIVFDPDDSACAGAAVATGVATIPTSYEPCDPVPKNPQDLMLDVTLRLGRMRLTLAQLGALRPGQVIASGIGGDEPKVEILIDGRMMGRGALIRIGDDWAVSIDTWLAADHGE